MRGVHKVECRWDRYEKELLYPCFFWGSWFFFRSVFYMCDVIVQFIQVTLEWRAYFFFLLPSFPSSFLSCPSENARGGPCMRFFNSVPSLFLLMLILSVPSRFGMLFIILIFSLFLSFLFFHTVSHPCPVCFFAARNWTFSLPLLNWSTSGIIRRIRIGIVNVKAGWLSWAG